MLFYYSLRIVFISSTVPIYFVQGTQKLDHNSVEDIEITEESLQSGVAINESYHQTESDLEGGYHSAPGCPTSLSGYTWVKHGSPPRCYLVGQRGPCEDEAKLGFRKNVSLEGYCKCQSCTDLPSDVDEVFCHLYELGKPIRTKSFALYNVNNRCYQLFKRGPCDDGQVFSLTKDTDKEPGCHQDICKSLEEGDATVFDPADSKCKTTGKQCLYQEPEWSGTYAFKSGSIFPSCNSIGGGGSPAQIENTSCANWEVYNHKLKRCIRPLRRLASTVG